MDRWQWPPLVLFEQQDRGRASAQAPGYPNPFSMLQPGVTYSGKPSWVCSRPEVTIQAVDPPHPTGCLFCGWNGEDTVLVCQTHSHRAMCPCLSRSSVWAGVLQPRPSAAPGGPGPPRGGPLSFRRPQCRRSQSDSRW